MPLIKIADYNLALKDDKGAFRLKLEGTDWSKWFYVTPAELAAISIMLTTKAVSGQPLLPGQKRAGQQLLNRLHRPH
jgi:hypothetical protein